MMMTSSDALALPEAVLKRKAVVYVRQSTQAPVQINLESQRRQYELVEVARRRGFRDIEVIDDDLGRSASGMVAGTPAVGDRTRFGAVELIVRDMQGDTITQVGVELDPAPQHAWHSWFQRLHRLFG
jgi:NhaP-type Na+/H+ and K+/H+ antiporter